MSKPESGKDSMPYLVCRSNKHVNWEAVEMVAALALASAVMCSGLALLIWESGHVGHDSVTVAGFDLIQ